MSLGNLSGRDHHSTAHEIITGRLMWLPPMSTVQGLLRMTGLEDLFTIYLWKLTRVVKFCYQRVTNNISVTDWKERNNYLLRESVFKQQWFFWCTRGWCNSQRYKSFYFRNKIDGLHRNGSLNWYQSTPNCPVINWTNK